MFSISYRTLLQQAYAHGNTSPDNDIFAKPKHQVKKVRKRRVSRDKDGNLVIKKTVIVSAVPTRSSKCNTTEQAVRAAVYGRVLGAAEDQSGFHRDLLRYLYNPLCSGQSALYAFWGLIARVQEYTIGLTPRQQFRVCCVVPMIIRDQMQVYRGGKRLFSDAELARTMGVRPQTYEECWKKHVLIIRAIIDRAEGLAATPVRMIVNEIHEEPLTAALI